MRFALQETVCIGSFCVPSGRKRNTTMDCGAVALRLELFFTKSFLCVAYMTWLPKHWKRSDRDWDTIRHVTGSHRVPSRTYRTHETCFCHKLRDASGRVVAARCARQPSTDHPETVTAGPEQDVGVSSAENRERSHHRRHIIMHRYS